MPESENTQICVFAYFMYVLVRALPKNRDQIQKYFFIKCYIDYVQIFFCVSSQKMAFQKIDFPLYFHQLGPLTLPTVGRCQSSGCKWKWKCGLQTMSRHGRSQERNLNTTFVTDKGKLSFHPDGHFKRSPAGPCPG